MVLMRIIGEPDVALSISIHAFFQPLHPRLLAVAPFMVGTDEAALSKL
jgi:hypothetical protein